MKVSQSKWLVCEEDGLIHVMPETDTKPHGIKINDEKYELSDTYPLTALIAIITP